MAKKQTGKALVKWDEELANLAKESTKGMNLPTAKFISIRSGKLSFGGAAVPGNELRCVVLGYTHENQYYDTEFNPDIPQVPACYAFGIDEDEMVPHDKAPDKQNDDCASCPLNEYGSADKGKGKACKNVLRLALIAESDLEDLDSAEIVYMKVPVMSVKNFLVYAVKVVKETLRRPYWSVITVVSVEPDDRSQFAVNFALAEKVSGDSELGSLKELYAKAMDEIEFPYPDAVQIKKLPAKGKVKAKPQKFARR